MGRRRDTGPAAGTTAPVSKRGLHTTAELALALPKPYEAFSDSPNLIDTERDDLAACEAAIDSLRLAFWAAGKALQIIRDGRLYRGTHATFEEYCDDRWDMSRAYADKLIRTWPIAEVLAGNGAASLNEAQMRPLAPLAEKHGTDAAILVYTTVAEDDRKVTAAVLAEAVAALEGTFDPESAADQIRAYLNRGDEDDVADDDPSLAFKAQAEKLRHAVTRTIGRPAFRASARTHPEEARELVNGLMADLQKVLKELDADPPE